MSVGKVFNDDLIDSYFEVKEAIHNLFGYQEDWVVIPLDDQRHMFWELDTSEVRYAETAEQLEDLDAGNYYEVEIYTQRFLPKWVYETDDHTMVCVDTHTDGNKFLMIFDNSKRINNEV